MEDLKPCPFCGGSAKFVPTLAYSTSPERDTGFVTCSKCHADSGHIETRKGAYKAWNRRATPENKEDSHEIS